MRIEPISILSAADAGNGRLEWERYFGECDTEKLSDYLVATDILTKLIMNTLRERHVQVQTSES